MNKNQNFFLEILYQKFKRGSDKEYGMQLTVNLKNMVDVDENEKDSVRKYLQVLMTLSDKHIAQSLNK